jgi:lipid II:glycine glycyltransferase (peptidoglycan interpeptide bridge formation enzyme)
VKAVQAGPDRRDEWNAFVADGSSFTLLQSWEWGDLKGASRWKPFRIAVDRDGRIVAGAQMLIAAVPPGVPSIAYVPRGPVGDRLDDDVVEALLATLDRIARRHRCIFLRFEPPVPDDPTYVQLLVRHGFRQSAYSNQPRATIVVDLRPGPSDVLAQMHQKTRYNIRYAERKGVVVRVGTAEDLPTFHRLLQTTGRRTGLNPRSYEYYRREWETFAPLGRSKLFIATYDGEPLAANLTAVFGRHAAYLHGASSGVHKELQPNHLLMWEAMRWAMQEGCESFDLWGVPDEVGLLASQGREISVPNTTEGLWGVYRFKRGFGGEIRLHTAAHDRVYSPTAYRVLGRAVNTPALDRLAALRDRLRGR